MQARSFAATVVLAGLLLIFAGISHAGGMMHKSGGDDGSANMTTETTPPDHGSAMEGEYGPTPGDEGEYNEAVGAGTLPISDDTNPAESEEDPWHTEPAGE